MERRLAAILAADVVGYSRLVREDEAGTLATLKAHREQLIAPKVAERKGRIVKLMGDGLLVDEDVCGNDLGSGMSGLGGKADLNIERFDVR